MSDFGTLIQRVLDDLERTDLTSVASVEIKSAIKHYNPKLFFFLECRATLNTADGTEYYGLPADFISADSLVITVNNNTRVLTERHYDTIEEWFVSSSTYKGEPTDFAVYQQQLRLYPIPNGAYSMRLSYKASLTELSANGDSNDWTDRGEELIRSRACKNIAARKLKDMSAAQVYGMLETDALKSLVSENVSHQMSGRTRRRRP